MVIAILLTMLLKFQRHFVIPLILQSYLLLGIVLYRQQTVLPCLLSRAFLSSKDGHFCRAL